MHHHRPDHNAQPRSEAIDARELQELLNRIYPLERTPGDLVPDDHATVAAVCEATGESEDRVWDLLTAIRREDMEARLAERIREAEEPLYRVERPGFQRDPLQGLPFFRRTRAFESELDNLGQTQDRKKRTKPKPSNHEVAANFAATAILILLLLAIVAIAIAGLSQRL
jgi:hypothetical protein